MSRGYLRYHTYVFRSKDPIIDAFVALRQKAKMSGSQVAKESKVSAGTIHGWEYGATRRPQFASVWAAARACGATGIGADVEGRPHFTTALAARPRLRVVAGGRR